MMMRVNSLFGFDIPGLQFRLEGHDPVHEPDFEKWALWFEVSGRERNVRRTAIGADEVSTVFMGFDADPNAWAEGGTPQLFETALLGDSDSLRVLARYETWTRAAQGHDTWVEQLLTDRRATGEIVDATAIELWSGAEDN